MGDPVIFKPLEADFGAYAENVDLTKPLSDATVLDLHEALNKYFFLIFKNQPLTKEQQKERTIQLGEWGNDELSEAIVENINDAPKFTYWHADGVFHDPPCKYSIFHMVIASHENGTTQFLNNIKALELMPDSLRDRMTGKTVVYWIQGSYVKLQVGWLQNYSKRENQLPLVYYNKIVNAEVLQYNLNLWKTLDGESQETSDEIKSLLKQYLETISSPSQKGVFFEYKWDDGDTIICNSAITAHRAGPGIVSQRLIQRTLAYGPLPM
jgi:alpha-ketoglutarate-dependent taurine dioxygenase